MIVARVNCYLPDDLRDQALAVDPPINFSELLRVGVIGKLRAARQNDESGEPAAPAPSPA